MKHVSILVPEGAASVGCMEGASTLFSRVNEHLVANGLEPAFELVMVGLDRDPRCYDRVFRIHPDVACDEVRRTDLIVIPAVNGEWEEVILANSGFFPWIRKMRSQGAEVASLCVGAFLLAASGVADGKSCSTHWLAAGEFQKMFPSVKLVADKIIAAEDGIYSSGGASAFWNLLLYLLEKYLGRDMAVWASKYFVLDMALKSQSPFMVFSGQKGHGDQTVGSVQEYLEVHYREKITVDHLSERFAVGRRTLERRFKKATGNTLNEYLTRVKVEAARRALETGQGNVSEVMYDVGYTDTKAFRLVFRKITGLTPQEYRNKYQRQAETAFLLD